MYDEPDLERLDDEERGEVCREVDGEILTYLFIGSPHLFSGSGGVKLTTKKYMLGSHNVVDINFVCLSFLFILYFKLFCCFVIFSSHVCNRIRLRKCNFESKSSLL